ncbi:MAG: two-component regulator propeller domain-containing protein [Bacteroidia bacterium]
MKFIRQIIVSFFVILNSLGIGQNLIFRHITNDDGLSTNFVSGIYQDSKGFMWFGTQDGLNKYDGYQLKIYKNEPNNANSLSYSEINCIAETGDNKLIIGTPSGLNFMNLTNDSIERFYFNTKDLFSSENYVNCVKFLDEKNLLVGTNSGLFKVDLTSRKTTFYLALSSDKKIEVKDIELFNGSVFIATKKQGLWTCGIKESKLARLDIKDEYSLLNGNSSLESINKIRSFAGKLYLATDAFGIIVVNPKNGIIDKEIRFGVSNNSERNYVKDIIINGNQAYCGTNYGLITYNLLSHDTVVYIKHPNAENTISDDRIINIFLDKNENLWVGTYVGGVSVSYKSSQKFISDARFKTREFKNLFLTYQDNDGNIWLSGDDKLMMLPFNGKGFIDNTFISGPFSILCALHENKGIYWFGSYGNGLIRYDANSRKVKKFLGEDVGGTILALKKINNYLLIATYGDGLFKLDLNSEEITQYKEKDGLESLNLTNIYQANDKSIWLLSDGAGAINIRDFDKTENKFVVIKHFEFKKEGGGLATDVVYAMNEDRNNHLWFATSNGLTRYDGKNFKSFFESDGLANTFIYTMLRDSTGKFWMSTNKGITSFNPTESNKPFFKNYTKKDGLINLEHFMGAACFSTKGNMLFGGANGYNIFRPSQIKDNLKVPNVYITSFKRSGKDINIDTNLIYKKSITLSWRENYFQMEMVALDFIEPEKNLYKYRLLGYEDNWSEPSNIRYLSYTELPGGTYTLQIKGSNSDGVWNETPYELVINIIPPFWKTKWFYFLVIIFGTGGVILFTQWRTRQIKKENRILENKVAERTKELAEKNRDITSSIEYAKRIQEAILPPREFIFSKLKDAFILYKPNDIVSGDFYWFGIKDDWRIFAVVDCTGHGVPGAFMSMIGHNIINQIVLENDSTEPGEILNSLHKGVQEALRQGKNEIDTNDGMDVSLIAVHKNAKEIKWAGANRPLVIINKEGELTKLDGNKYPIGGAQFDIDRMFTTHTLFVEHGTSFYMSSDGYADQFGGQLGKKFMVRRFNDLLKTIHTRPMQEQKTVLAESFELWKGTHEQIDDVLVVGIAL